jgi:two-component SAPR family response regulator
MRIRLLGAFVVESDGRDAAARPWRLRKSRTLVKVLALAPEQRMHRDRLLDLLWPDLPASAAANNLHQALHVARRQLIDARDEDVLVIRDGVVVLHAAGAQELPGVAVDRRSKVRQLAGGPGVCGQLAETVDVGLDPRGSVRGLGESSA